VPGKSAPIPLLVVEIAPSEEVDFPSYLRASFRWLASEETCLILAYCSKGNPGSVHGDAVHFRDADQQCQIRFGAADPW